MKQISEQQTGKNSQANKDLNINTVVTNKD